MDSYNNKIGGTATDPHDLAKSHVVCFSWVIRACYDTKQKQQQTHSSTRFYITIYIYTKYVYIIMQQLHRRYTLRRSRCRQVPEEVSVS